MHLSQIWRINLIFAIVVTSVTGAPLEPALQNGNARVVLVGDSITGLSRNAGGQGWAYQMENALQAVYPDAKPNIIALGGSGQGVASWSGVEKNSRTNSVKLDVPGINVKETLDQPADVLVIMLGINDVLAPYVGEDQRSLDGWQTQYEQLIETLGRRITPRVIGLAQITPMTEEMSSPKNRLIAALNKRVETIAKKLDLRVLPVGDCVREILAQGRTLRPDFHISYDFVHPNEAGQIGIAIGMLEGLGEHKAADWLREQPLSKIWKGEGQKPSISWAVLPMTNSVSSESQTFRVRYWWPPVRQAADHKPRVELVVPKGWQVSPSAVEEFTGEFTVTGTPDQIKNILSIQGRVGDEQRRTDVPIPTPWLVAAKLVQPVWEKNTVFQPDPGRTPIDQAIEAGANFIGDMDVGHGQKLTWQRYYPSVNYTGLAAPSSVDFAAITHAVPFEGGYGARWIYSDRDRPVQLQLGTAVFAGNIHLAVWINGAALYRGHIMSEPLRRKSVEAHLQKGWNTLVFKANHCTWQWQVLVDLAPNEGDSLANLRYETTPH